MIKKNYTIENIISLIFEATEKIEYKIKKSIQIILYRF